LCLANVYSHTLRAYSIDQAVHHNRQARQEVGALARI
jgi:hypothetical protein